MADREALSSWGQTGARRGRPPPSMCRDRRGGGDSGKGCWVSQPHTGHPGERQLVLSGPQHTTGHHRPALPFGVRAPPASQASSLKLWFTLLYRSGLSGTLVCTLANSVQLVSLAHF